MIQMGRSGPEKKVANSLVAMSCAAVLTVYSAGYARTRAAAEQFEAQSAERRPAAPDSRREISSGAGESAAVTGAVTEVAVGDEVPVSVPAAIVPSPVAKGEVAESIPSSTPVAVPVAVAAEEVPAMPPVAVVAPVQTPAPVPVVTPATPPAAPAPKWRDGSYTGWGTSRHGDIQAQVDIEGGRILQATIIQCLTRYSCDVIDMLPPQVAARQSPDVDYVSRATQSADAFYYAVVEALGKASTAK